MVYFQIFDRESGEYEAYESHCGRAEKSLIRIILSDRVK
jgi:hypothetical protein